MLKKIKSSYYFLTIKQKNKNKKMEKEKHKCKDCSREISAEEYAKNKGKCDRCSIGDLYA